MLNENGYARPWLPGEQCHGRSHWISKHEEGFLWNHQKHGHWDLCTPCKGRQIGARWLQWASQHTIQNSGDQRPFQRSWWIEIWQQGKPGHPAKRKKGTSNYCMKYIANRNNFTFKWTNRWLPNKLERGDKKLVVLCLPANTWETQLIW
jgi:hypothetical protein